MALDSADSQKLTLASSVYERLRDDIITGSQPATLKLNIRDLCERFSVGLTPMREALSRLSSEGLIKQTDHRGFSVAPVGLEDLEDLTKARCWINETGLRESIAHGGHDWEERVILSCYRLQRTPRYLAEGSEERNPEWERAHRNFHIALVSGCGSEWLVSVCDRLFDASERYRHVARRAGVVRSTAEDEHRAIMEAAVKRDASLAVDLLNAHFQRTAELVRKVVKAGGELMSVPRSRKRGAAKKPNTPREGRTSSKRS